MSLRNDPAKPKSHCSKCRLMREAAQRVLGGAGCIGCIPLPFAGRNVALVLKLEIVLNLNKGFWQGSYGDAGWYQAGDAGQDQSEDTGQDQVEDMNIKPWVLAVFKPRMLLAVFKPKMLTRVKARKLARAKLRMLPKSKRKMMARLAKTGDPN